MILPRILIFVAITTVWSGDMNGQWFSQLSNTSANLYGVWFADSSNGWVCGDSGIILHTSNAGRDWARQCSGLNVGLKDLFFSDGLSGWACGDSGTIIHTTDAGSSWTKTPTTVHSTLWHIEFTTPDIGFASGSRETALYKDSGKTWTADPYSDTGNGWVALHWMNRARGTEIFYPSDSSSGSQSNTTNFGSVWFPTARLLPPRINRVCGIHAVFPTDSLEIWCDVGTNGTVLLLYIWNDDPRGWPGPYGKYGESGDTTDINSVTLEESPTIIKFWAVGARGWILSSLDSGVTWQTVPSNVLFDLHGIHFPVQGRGWVVGDSGVILHLDQVTSVKVRPTLRGSTDSPSLSTYPNPFNPGVSIRFALPRADFVSLTIYDVLGRKVATLVERREGPGEHEVKWNAAGYPGGIYFCTLRAGVTIAKRLLLAK